MSCYPLALTVTLGLPRAGEAYKLLYTLASL